MVPTTSFTNSSSSGLLRFFVLFNFDEEEEGSAAEPARMIGVGLMIGVAGSALGGTGEVEVEVDMDMEVESGMLSVAVVGILGRCGWLARPSTAIAGSVQLGKGAL